jgi:hypothetical protein
VWLRHGWSEQDTAPEQLYDLVFDPQERANVVEDPRYQPALEAMRGRLDRWMRATDDPLLRGTVPAPPGAFVGRPEMVSPSDLPRR